MSLYNGIVSEPINQADVQGALSISSSVNKWSQLLPHVNNNMWAADKPMYATKLTKLTSNERANPVGQSVRPAVSGYTISYGIMKRISSAWSDFINTSTGDIKSAPWIYDRPVWDNICKFRIRDFAGYHHNAKRLVNIAFSSADLWLPSAAGSAGYNVWGRLTGMSSISSDNTGAMRWQELFGDHLDYYPTLIMTAGTNWQYSISSDYTIRDLINRGDTGIQIYVNTDTLASAMVSDGGAYNYYPLNNNATWNMTMVLCSYKVTGEVGPTLHKIRSGANILRLEYLSGADRIIKTAKLLKYKTFASMKMQATLRKETGSYNYRLDEIVIIAEKLTEDAVDCTCSFMLSSQVGSVNVQGMGGASGGQTYTANNYLGTIRFASGEVGTITKTFRYNGTSGNSIPYTTYSIPTAQSGSGQRLATGSFSFTVSSGTTTIGTFSNGWESININNQYSMYYREFTLF